MSLRLCAGLAVIFSAHGTMDCADQCRPWSWAEPGGEGKACKVNSDMDFRLLVGDTRETEPGSDQSYGDFGALQYKTYFFCPKVDEFTAVEAQGSAALFNTTRNVKLYASAYGAGKSSEVRFPEVDQDASVMVWDGNHTKCPGSGAIANFLLYNVTLKDGNYRYKNSDPIGTGFVNTCDSKGTSCVFDSSSFCIGEGGRYNCAQCANTAGAGDIQVLMSYYGTDSTSKNFLSGSSNPLNFRAFAIGNVYSDVKGGVSNIKFPDLPVR
eukprot:TRINITY_DN20293_c0_g1_i1.p1 TRINITY_DN20293_c0_g1~~TRINITY_DN20293_c0_g1_i1.p1  ORF type:complete len:288 (+),score=43.87 TRINITY_DN20293_c0_g1_i1:65-865(+)